MQKRIGIILGVVVAICSLYFLFFRTPAEVREVMFSVNYNGTSITEHMGTENSTVEEALRKAGYELAPDSFVFPERTAPVFAGTVITFHSAKTVTVEDHNETRTAVGSALTIGQILEQVGVTLEGADFVEPVPETATHPGMTIAVTRVTVSEETEETKIPFKKVEEEDENVSFLVKKVTQKGETGIRTTRYKVSRHNNTIVAKEKIDESITKEPVDEKTTIGTKVTVVKKHTGGASWYAHTGTLSAANPWLPYQDL